MRHGRLNPPGASGGASPPLYAGFWRRLAGSVIDWAASFIAPALVLSFAAVEGGLTFLWALLLVLVVGYFLFSWTRGQSAGMKLLGIRLVDAETGEPPGVRRASVRLVLTLVFVASGVLLLVAGFSDRPAGVSAPDVAAYSAAGFFFVSGVFGHLWMVWDPKRQTVKDKLSGVLVVRQRPLACGDGHVGGRG